MTTKTPDGSVVFGPADKVALVAGSGLLPLEVATALQAQAVPFTVFMIDGEADGADFPAGTPSEGFSLGAFAPVVSALKRRGFTHLVMAGGVGRRPRWHEIRLNWPLLKAIGKVAFALRSGDDGLLGTLVRGIEEQGIKVVGAHQVAPDLIMEEGVATRRRPSSADLADLRAAREAAKAIGRLDIGQAAVAIGGRAVELEGVEGTDALLRRVASLRGHGRLAGRRGGVLVKCAKPGQELRADLPTLGPSTIEAAQAAGLAGVGLEAGRALVLNRAETIRLADALGLFLVGLPREETS